MCLCLSGKFFSLGTITKHKFKIKGLPIPTVSRLITSLNWFVQKQLTYITRVVFMCLYVKLWVLENVSHTSLLNIRF